ncbi:MAG: 2-enoyl thioester reductase domain-containing protein [Candidatus Methylacidiphilales bacterium]|nr:2-enoyl thioester reductase domain-containing protein [Candidatus Methylacidiphilales bacterium]
MSKALRFSQHGAPLEVLSLEEDAAGLRALAAHEVRVAVKLAPVHPADINVLEGSYAALPQLPATPGNEAVAQIIEVGHAATQSGWRAGQLVHFRPGAGTWREHIVIDAAQLTAVPDGISLEQAATLVINPATAWRMLHDFATLQPGDWVVQNAANSAVGLCVIEIAHALGFKTINVVRREELIPELKALGADSVVLEDIKLRKEVKSITGGAPLRLALNAVGGDSGVNLAGALAHGGVMVTYGGMSRQPVRLPTGQLIFNDIAARGFWITAWYKRASQAETTAMTDSLAKLMREGKLQPKIDKTFALADYQQAIARAMEGGRSGKVFFRM